MSTAFQAQYTSVAEGPTGRSGFQFTCWSRGLNESRLGELQRFLTYRTPPNYVPDGFGSAPPLSLQFQRLAEGYVLIHTAYAGSDYSGREGNYLSHILVIEESDAPVGVTPLGLLLAADLGRQLPIGDELEPVQLDELVDRVAEYTEPLSEASPSSLRTFASGVGLAVSQDNIVYVADEPARAIEWVALAFEMLPPSVWWSLTFNTYSSEVRLGHGHLRCTTLEQSPEPQRYEFESSCSLIKEGARADGRITPFGSVVASLIEQNDPAAVGELANRLDTVPVPLASEDFDAFAIAFDGDPALHDLTVDDGIRALETLLWRGGEAFNARHLGWLFETLPVDRAELIARIHNSALASSGDLGGGIREMCLKWLLGHPAAVPSGALRGGTGAPGETKALFEAIERVDIGELAKCLELAYNSGLVTSSATSASVGTRVAERLVDSGDFFVAGEVADVLDRASLETLTDGLLDAVDAGTAPTSVLEPGSISAQLVERLAVAPDFDTALRLLRLLGRRYADLDPSRLIDLAGSAEDLEVLMAEFQRWGAIDESLLTDLLEHCASLGIEAPVSLLSASSECLLRGTLPPTPGQVELARALRASGDYRDRVAWAVLASLGVPQDPERRLNWVRESLDESHLPAEWAVFLRRRALEQVASVPEPTEHNCLLEVVLSEGGTIAVDEYLDTAISLASSRGTKADLGACLFMVWLSRRERSVKRGIPQLVGALSERKRERIEQVLPGSRREAWGAWCEKVPTKGFFGRLGRS